MAVTKTIGSAGGRDYATIALWAAYVNALDLASATSQIGDCYNDSEFTSAAQITLGGWTNADATHTVTLEAASGQGIAGNGNKLTNALRYNQSNGVGLASTNNSGSVLVCSGDRLTVTGIQVKLTGTASEIFNVSGNNATIDACIIQYARASAYGLVRMVLLNSGSGIVMQNCLVLNQANSLSSKTGIAMGSNMTVTDCAIVNTGTSNTSTGIVAAYSGNVVKNCAIAGWGTDCSGTASASSTNNATDKGSFGGTNYGSSGQTSLVGATEWQSVTAGSEDYRVNSTSVKLKGNGATTGPSTDIVGQARVAPYTIGCWQFVAGGSPFLLINQTP